MSKTASSKVFEAKFNEYLSKLIYASLHDLDENSNDEKINQNLFITHKTFSLDKSARVLLKAQFKIGYEIKQFLTILFHHFISELNDISIEEKDDNETIKEKLLDINSDCFSAFLFSQKKIELSPTLAAAGDNSNWFYSQLTGGILKYSTNHTILAKINAEFDYFMKVIAFNMGCYVQFAKNPLNCKYFVYLLSTMGMDQLKIDLLVDDLKVKEVKQKKSII